MCFLLFLIGHFKCVLIKDTAFTIGDIVVALSEFYIWKQHLITCSFSLCCFLGGHSLSYERSVLYNSSVKTKFVTLLVKVPSLKGVSSVLLGLLFCGTSKHGIAHYLPPLHSQKQFLENKTSRDSIGTFMV